MRALLVVGAAVCIAVLLSAFAPPASAAPAPSIDAARADFDSGDYPACMRKVSALLSSKAARADSPERYDLLMLRGECMLRLKQRVQAADTFEAAAKAMKTKRDLPRAATATAMAVLAKSSAPDLTYKPKGSGGGSSLSIVEPDARKAAMAALFHDLNEKVGPRIDKAVQDTSLRPTQAVLRDAWELYTVEYAATGAAASTESKLEQLGGHARSLIAEELARLTGRLEQLKDLASEPTWVTTVISYRGLTTNERTELKETADYLVQIQRTCENARRIAQALGRTGENWDGLLADCAVARDVAQEAYDRRY